MPSAAYHDLVLAYQRLSDPHNLPEVRRLCAFGLPAVAVALGAQSLADRVVTSPAKVHSPVYH